MPYPRTIIPNRKCTVHDGHGAFQNNLDVQLIKPWLGLSFNGPQALILGTSMPNMAGAILRGLVIVNTAPALNIRPGPTYWAEAKPPAIVLNEDPTSVTWVWSDAIPWDYGTAQRVWQFWAAASYIPPLPPIPIAPGTTGAGATLIQLGSTYIMPLTVGVANTAYFVLPYSGAPLQWEFISSAPAATMTINAYHGAHASPLGPDWSRTAQPTPITVDSPPGAFIGPEGLIAISAVSVATNLTFRVSLA